MADDFILVTTSKCTHKVFHCNIIRVEAQGPYSCIYIGMDKCCTCKNLKMIMEELKSHPNFFRVHRSYVINIDKVYRIMKKGRQCILLMQDGARVPVAKRCTPAFLKFYAEKITKLGLLRPLDDKPGQMRHYPVNTVAPQPVNIFRF